MTSEKKEKKFIIRLINRPIEIILISALFITAYQLEENQKSNAYAQLREKARADITLFQTQISQKIISNLQKIEKLKTTLSQNWQWSQNEFANHASSVFLGQSEIKNIAVAKNYKVEYIYPFEGNEKALNIDYRNIPDQFPTVNEVVLNGQTIITNLVNLVQGGQAIIIREPYYKDPSSNTPIWGLISVVLDTDELFAPFIEYNKNSPFNMAIKSLDQSAGDNIQLFGDPNIYNHDPIISTLYLDGNEWEFAITPKENWYQSNHSVWPLRITALGVLILFLLLNQERRKKARLIFQLKEEVIIRKKAELEAEQSNKTKSQFLANMSHDLRTPLNAIMGFSEMIFRQMQGPIKNIKYTEYAEAIHNSSEYLLQLINDILDISKIEAGEFRLAKEMFDVNILAKECCNLMSTLAEDKAVTLNFKSQSKTLFINADKRALRQIMINLLSNAIKFSHEKSAVEFQTKKVGDKCCIIISDHGIGIEPDKIDLIVEPFIRSENDYKKAHEGTGLGLAIVKSLVQLHEGQLKIESKLGVSTKVTVTLPVQA